MAITASRASLEVELIALRHLEHGAVQCGYSMWLLHVNARPDTEQVIDALRGNLSRCTGYKKIVEVVEAVARG